MINATQVRTIVENGIAETDMFLVDVIVSASNHIEIEIDSPKGITIKECQLVNKIIEENLSRDVEDYSLEVASPGLSKSLKIVPQYLKNIGRNVHVITNDGNEIEGELTAATEAGFEVKTEEKVRLEGKKKKELVTTMHQLEYDKVKSTHIIISFK